MYDLKLNAISTQDSLTNRTIAQRQITDNDIYQDNIDIAIDTIFQQQVTRIKPAWKT